MFTEEYSFFAVGLITREQNLRMLCLRYSHNKHLIEFIQGPTVEKQLLKKLSTTMFFRQVRFIFIIFKWANPGLFFFIFVFFWIAIDRYTPINSKNFADVGILTMDLWCRKRPLSQLRHNHSQRFHFVILGSYWTKFSRIIKGGF